jgi:hypothetical protein
MSFLTIVTIGFLILESTNVVALYFFPDTRYANGIGVFKAWEKSKSNADVHDLVKYLVNWVAGTKLIFILLMIVILAIADDQTLFFAGIALALSIASFFWRLFPMIRKMDRAGQIEPTNYSTTLGVMIGGFILVFVVAVILSAAF